MPLDQVVVKLKLVNSNAVASLNGVDLAILAQLQLRLRAISQVRADIPVVIDPEGQSDGKGCCYRHALGRRQAGLSRVYLATRK